jgi:hypothetical protein
MPAAAEPYTGAPLVSAGTPVPGLTQAGAPNQNLSAGAIPAGQQGAPTQAQTTNDPNAEVHLTGIWQGYRTPFKVATVPTSAGARGGTSSTTVYQDAAGREVPKGVYDSWIAAGSPKQGSPGSSVTTADGRTFTVPGGAQPYDGGGPNAIAGKDVRTAQQVFEDTIKRGDDLYNDITAGGPKPAPTSIPKPIVAPGVNAPQIGPANPIQVTEQGKVTVAGTNTDALRAAGQANITPGTVQAGTVDAAQMSPAQRLAAAQQRATTVEATDTNRLEQTAEGQGAIAQNLAANLRLAQQRSTQQRQGLVAQARGNERRGARRALVTGGGAEDLAVADTIIARTTEQQMAATNQLAALDSQRKTLQAQLDAARAANDQDAINTISMKMADLDSQREQVNAQLRQTAATDNANRDVEAQKFNVATATDVDKFKAAQRFEAEKHIADLTQARNVVQAQLDQARAAGDQAAYNAAAMKLAELDADINKTNAAMDLDVQKFRSGQEVDIQKWNIDTALKAQGQEFDQWLSTGDLRIKATEVAQKGAQNLLNEDQRQRALAMAQREFDESIRRFNLNREDQKAAADRQFWGNIISSILSGGTQVAAAASGGAADGGITAGPTLAGEGNRPELVIPIEGKLSDRMRAALAVDNKPFAKGMPASRLAAVLAAANLVDRKAKVS